MAKAGCYSYCAESDAHKTHLGALQRSPTWQCKDLRALRRCLVAASVLSRAARGPVRARFEVDIEAERGLACRLTVPRRSRGQGLRARCVLASCGRGAALTACAAA